MKKGKEGQSVSFVLELINLTNLNDKSKPSHRLTYWFWFFQPVCGRFDISLYDLGK